MIVTPTWAHPRPYTETLAYREQLAEAQLVLEGRGLNPGERFREAHRMIAAGWLSDYEKWRRDVAQWGVAAAEFSAAMQALGRAFAALKLRR